MQYSRDHAKQATSYSRAAGAATRRGVTDAHHAATWYERAAHRASSARWLTQRPHLWMGSYTPASEETAAAMYTRIADMYLRSSFGADQRAAECRASAAFYRDLAAKRDARMAALVT